MSQAFPAGSAADLAGLAQRLAAGLGRLPASFRNRHSAYLLAAQRPDGGFAGRRGGSDLYYTSFALRCAELLGMNDLSFWRGAAEFVEGRAAPPADIVECFCLLGAGKLIAERSPTGRRGEAPAGVMDAVRSFSARSGGYARMPGGPAGVYHTFLAAQCSRLSDCDLPGAGEAAAFVMSRRCADGGYADSGPSDHAPGRTGGKEGEGGTNPTAAAVTLLAMLGALDGAAASEAAGFLASMQRAEGGFASCTGAPAADLLSTFTALVALDGLGALHMVKLAPVARFVQSLEAAGGPSDAALPSAGPEPQSGRGTAGPPCRGHSTPRLEGHIHRRGGGFRGSSGDDAPDVEYTYYGLGTLGLLGWTAAHTNRTE